MLRNSTYRSSLTSTVKIQLILHPCNPFFMSNLNMTANSVEKHCFVALNVNLQVKIRFKTTS